MSYLHLIINSVSHRPAVKCFQHYLHFLWTITTEVSLRSNIVPLNVWETLTKVPLRFLISPRGKDQRKWPSLVLAFSLALFRAGSNQLHSTKSCSKCGLNGPAFSPFFLPTIANNLSFLESRFTVNDHETSRETLLEKRLNPAVV